MPRPKDDKCGGDEQDFLTGAANLELSGPPKAKGRLQGPSHKHRVSLLLLHVQQFMKKADYKIPNCFKLRR